MALKASQFLSWILSRKNTGKVFFKYFDHGKKCSLQSIDIGIYGKYFKQKFKHKQNLQMHLFICSFVSLQRKVF